MHETTPFFRLGFTIRATRDIVLPGRPAATLYALLSKANEQSEGSTAFPQDLMLDAPETNRTTVRKQQAYAFGGTLLDSSPEDAAQIVMRLQAGLQRLGQQGRARDKGLGGNFRLDTVTDLVAAAPWSATALQAIPLDHVNQETQLLEQTDQIELVFETPLRMERPKQHRRRSHSFFDDRYFGGRYFVRRLMRRLSTIGVQPRDSPPDEEELAVTVVDNQLIWLDIAYGGKRGKTLGGAVGRVRLQVSHPVTKAALVWGQYARLGKNTSFGFGRYRIASLGIDRFRCRRAVPLLQTAWNHPASDRLVRQVKLEPGLLSAAIDDINDHSYQPHPHTTLKIGEADQQRTLQIPSRRDRTLQRLVLESIAPGIDQLFESSSFAWRRGLGRHDSARAIGRAYKAGYRFAIHADFDRFFESITHGPLAVRLSAYVDDRPTCQLIMQWVRSACPDQGIPTGAPLSPLLGNLMLDRFDEKIHNTGGRLVRYGDDLLILCKQHDDAKSLAATAWAEAKALELELNESTTLLDLDEPFTFLGFRFERYDRWQVTGSAEPRRLEELGWQDASQKQRPARRLQLQIAGETGRHAQHFGLTGIVGPGATHFEVGDDHVVCHYDAGIKNTTIPTKDLETLVALGRVGFNAAMVRRLCDRNISLILADERGLVYATMTDDDILAADLVTAQLDAARDPSRRLLVAQGLIAAKLHNHARLAAALLKPRTAVVDFLLESSQRAQQADSIESLLGIEGAGAARWFQVLGDNLGRGFHFPRRVAPAAQDPVNILLNIGQTLLYRLTGLMIRSVGLVPGIGLLHHSSRRFDALASDLQEPLRHLVDRVVIEATHELKPGDFFRDSGSSYPLSLTRSAARRFQWLLWQGLSLETADAAGGDADGYRVWMHRQVRSLSRYLQDPAATFQPFRHP